MRTGIGYIILGALALLAPGGCSVHEFPVTEAGGVEKGTVRLHLGFETEFTHFQTVEYPMRSSVEVSQLHDIRHTVEAYRADMAGNFGRTTHSRVVVTGEEFVREGHTVEMSLEPGDYRFIVWTDYVDQGARGHKYYNTDNFADIALHGDGHFGATHFRDAFTGVQDAVIAALETKDIQVAMRRPLARYSFVATDLDRFTTRALQAGKSEGEETRSVDLGDYRVVFHYTGFMPSAFNAFTGRPSDASTGVSFVGDLRQIGETEAELGFDYVFVNGEESSVQVAVRIYDADGELVSGVDPVDVPIFLNGHTTVKGEFLTSEASGNVGIDPGFDGNYDYPVD